MENTWRSVTRRSGWETGGRQRHWGFLIYAFDDCELDSDWFELGAGRPDQTDRAPSLRSTGGAGQERHRVVPKNELLDTIWGDRFVSESALTSRVKAARQAIGDDGRGQRLIRTVHGRGYQFIGPVSETPQVTVLPVAADPPPQEIRFLYRRRRHSPRVRDHRQRPAAREGRELVQPSGLRLAEFGMAALAGRAVAPVPVGSVRRARCGLSDWDVAQFSFDSWVDDLEAVVDAVGLDRFPLLGISQGGPVAIAYAVRHPERVSHLVLLARTPRAGVARPYPDELALRRRGSRWSG